MAHSYDAAVASMHRWRDLEKWTIYVGIVAPLLLFLIPLDIFFMGWFLLIAFAVYAHCCRVRWRKAAASLDEETNEYAQTDDSY